MDNVPLVLITCGYFLSVKVTYMWIRVPFVYLHVDTGCLLFTYMWIQGAFCLLTCGYRVPFVYLHVDTECLLSYPAHSDL